MEKQIIETKRRLRDWWQDPKALGRPIVLCNRVFQGQTTINFEYFTYPRMIIQLLGNDALKAQLRAAQDAPYKEIPPLPKAPTGIKLNFQEPQNAEILAQIPRQIESMIGSSPYGESIPILRSQAGAGFPGCCLGEFSCIPTTGPNTIWYETVRRWEELENLILDETSPWWQFMIEITKNQLELAPNWVGVGFPSMSGTTDILQSLRGTQKMLRDMLMEKTRVKKALDQINIIYNEVIDRFWGEIKQKRDGSGAFIGIWAPGNTPSVQCDALAYLGPRQFQDFALPYIKADLEHADYGTYHLDGPGAIKYLDELLKIPKLDLIQWVHGAGQPDGVSLKWIPLVKKVLKAGKRIILYTTIDRIPQFMRKMRTDGINPCGVVFSIGNVREFEIDQFLPWLERSSPDEKDPLWYSEEFWEEYQEIIQEDRKRYEDLFTGAVELELDYKNIK